MRVLHIITTLAAGGAGHQLRLLVRGLPYDAEVVTLSPPDRLTAAIRWDGAPVHELARRGETELAVVGALRRLIRHGRFDVVHTHLYRPAVAGRLAARLAGVPAVVATEHALEPLRPGEQLRYLAAERLGQITMAASPAIAARLRRWGVAAARIALVPPAVDAAEFRYDPALRATTRARLGIGPREPVVGAVGRLEPRHRFDRLIRAVATVPGMALLLVGDGPARPALQRLARIEGVGDRVHFAGAVPHVRDMLCAMDVFASPADRGTAGLPVLEALAAGLPAVYAACPPLDELAAARRPVPGAHRLSAHDPESLPRSLRTELLCLEERDRARLPARSAGPRYDVAHLAAAVDEVYRRALRSVAHRRRIRVADRAAPRQRALFHAVAHRGRAQRTAE